jgi:hypothetical protein
LGKGAIQSADKGGMEALMTDLEIREKALEAALKIVESRIIRGSENGFTFDSVVSDTIGEAKKFEEYLKKG